MSNPHLRISWMATVLVAGSLVAPATAQTTQGQSLPSAEEVLERMVEASGGEAAIRKHKFQTLKATMAMPGGRLAPNTLRGLASGG